jgi:hypothetical protein
VVDSSGFARAVGRFAAVSAVERNSSIAGRLAGLQTSGDALNCSNSSSVYFPAISAIGFVTQEIKRRWFVMKASMSNKSRRLG